MKIEMQRIFRFVLFGMISVAVDYLTMMGAMALNCNQVISKILGFLAALAFVIIFVGRVVFPERTSVRPQLVGGLYLLSGTINVLLFAELTKIEIGTDIAFLAATGVSAGLNYSALRFFISR